MFYNFCRVHDFLRCTPAVAAGVSDHFWSIEELIDRALGTQPMRRSRQRRNSASGN